MNENIVTGKKYRILVDELSNLWDRISFWTKASDVEFDDGTVLETKMNDVASKVDTADSKARTAQALAITAQEEAAEAHTRANTAYTNADTAQALASNAWQLAESADAKAIDIQTTVNGITQGTTTTTPKSHAVAETTYGTGADTRYGHVKLSDALDSMETARGAGTAASPYAVNRLRQFLIAPHAHPDAQTFYFDYKDGKYGWNEQADRSGTFHPFSSGAITWSDTIALGNMSSGHSYNYTASRTFDTLFFFIQGHSWQPVTASISSGGGTMRFSLTDNYGGGSAACFQDVKKNAVITLTGSGDETNSINAVLYGTTS